MAITKEYYKEFEKAYTKIVYELLKEKLFVAFGLELTATHVVFEDNSNFALLEKTFAYYCPIDDTIHINIEDPFFISCTNSTQRDAKLIFILFHEAYHKMLMHSDRLNKRDQAVWNIACDYEVHNMLYLYKECCLNENNYSSDKFIVNSTMNYYFKIINNMLEQWDNKNYKPNEAKGEIVGLFDTNLLDKIAEEIYLMIINTKQINKTSYSMSLSDMMNKSQNDSRMTEDKHKDNKSKVSGADSNIEDNNHSANINDSTKVTITEVTYTLPNGKKHTAISIDWPNINTKSKERQQIDKNNKDLRKHLMEQNLRQQFEKNKGNMSEKISLFLKKVFKIKIDWEKILKSSLQTILAASDYFTWSMPRTSVYSTLDMYLPSISPDPQAYGTLIVARDESGSMSDEEVAKCGSIIAAAKEHYKKIIILKHDTEIQYEGEFEELNNDVINMLCTRSANGGTSHKCVFEYINKYWKASKYDEENKISCVILMTDCCSDIQEHQKLVSSEIPMIYLVPENSIQYTKNIKGKIIPITL